MNINQSSPVTQKSDDNTNIDRDSEISITSTKNYQYVAMLGLAISLTSTGVLLSSQQKSLALVDSTANEKSDPNLLAISWLEDKAVEEDINENSSFRNRERIISQLSPVVESSELKKSKPNKNLLL